MGSSGAFLESGGFTEYGWQSIGKYKGIKILQKKNLGNKKNSLPYFSNTPGTGYLEFDEKGIFKQYRQYGEDRRPIFDLDYSEHEHKLSLHLHNYENGERSQSPIIIATPEGGILNSKLYNKFKYLLKGVKL